jgi:ribosome-interacting GTPase 1
MSSYWTSCSNRPGPSRPSPPRAARVWQSSVAGPSKPWADLDQPFALTEGSTVGDLARAIHQDLVAKFKFARVWGPSAYDGQKVHQGHELAEGDVVEIHI